MTDEDTFTASNCVRIRTNVEHGVQIEGFLRLSVPSAHRNDFVYLYSDEVQALREYFTTEQNRKDTVTLRSFDTLTAETTRM